jgi:hypothetical protein
MVRFAAHNQRYSTTTFGVPSGSFSILCWASLAVDRNTYSAVWALMDPSGSPYWHLITGGDGTNLGMHSSGGATGGSTVTDLTTATWWKTAVIFNGTSMTYYAASAGNALTLRQTETGSAGTPASRAMFYIAGDNLTNEFFNGSVANVKVYSAALAVAECEVELAQYRPTRLTNLVRWHPLITPETTDYAGTGDFTTNGANPTVSHGPPIRFRRARPRYVNLAGVISDYATVAVPAQQAVVSVQVNADCANITITGHNPGLPSVVAAQAAAPVFTSEQPLGAVGAVAETATFSADAQQATRGTPSNAPGDVASVSMSGQDAKVLVSSVSDYSFWSIETVGASTPPPPSDVPVPSTTLVPSTSLVPRSAGIGLSPIGLAAQTALAKVSVVAGVATVAMAAADALAGIAPPVGFAVVTVAAQDPARDPLVLAPADVASVTLTGQDAKTLVSPTPDDAELFVAASQARNVAQAPVPSGSLVPSTSLVPNTSSFFVDVPAGLASIGLAAQQPSNNSRVNAGVATLTVVADSAFTPLTGQGRAETASITVTAGDTVGFVLGQGYRPTVVFDPKKRFGIPLRGHRRA